MKIPYDKEADPETDIRQERVRRSDPIDAAGSGLSTLPATVTVGTAALD